jgi:hypothetical protein
MKKLFNFFPKQSLTFFLWQFGYGSVFATILVYSPGANKITKIFLFLTVIVCMFGCLTAIYYGYKIRVAEVKLQKMKADMNQLISDIQAASKDQPDDP